MGHSGKLKAYTTGLLWRGGGVCMYMHDANVYSYYTLWQIDIIE